MITSTNSIVYSYDKYIDLNKGGLYGAMGHYGNNSSIRSRINCILFKLHC